MPTRRYILVRWNNGCKQLRQVNDYLAVLNEDNTADILRVVDPGEGREVLARIEAREGRALSPPQPIAQARAAASTQRTPPEKKPGLF